MTQYCLLKKIKWTPNHSTPLSCDICSFQYALIRQADHDTKSFTLAAFLPASSCTHTHISALSVLPLADAFARSESVCELWKLDHGDSSTLAPVMLTARPINQYPVWHFQNSLEMMLFSNDTDLLLRAAPVGGKKHHTNMFFFDIFGSSKFCWLEPMILYLPPSHSHCRAFEQGKTFRQHWKLTFSWALNYTYGREDGHASFNAMGLWKF